MIRLIFALLLLLVAESAESQIFPVPGPGHAQYAGGGGDVTPPAVPTGLAATPVSSQVTLNWSHSNPGDVDEYVVQYRCPSGSGGYTESTPRPTTPTKVVSGLTNGVQCDFRVAAEDTSNNQSAFTTAIQSTPTAGTGFATSHWPDWSARCDYLDAHYGAGTCVCNETLDNNDGAKTNTSNPSASVNKQCVANFLDGTSYDYVAANSLIGDSLPGAGYVLRVNNAGHSVDGHTGGKTWTDKTICLRSYEMLETNYAVPNGAIDDRIKQIRFESGGNSDPANPGTEISSANACNGSNANTCEFNWDFCEFHGCAFGVVNNPTTYTPSKYTLGNIRGHWIRIEMCFDHYPLGHPLAHQMLARGKVTRLSDLSVWTMSELLPNPQTVAHYIYNEGGLADFIVHLDSPNYDDGSQWRYASSALLAILPTVDDTFWIDGDCELEGGC